MLDAGGRHAPVLAVGHDLAHHVLVFHIRLFDAGNPVPDVAPLGLEVLQLDAALVPGLLAALAQHLLAHVGEDLAQHEVIKSLTVIFLFVSKAIPPPPQRRVNIYSLYRAPNLLP
jgi:hypothetical protein